MESMTLNEYLELKRKDNEKLVAACWAMYSAIQQAQACDIYNDALNSLIKIAKDVMYMCDQIGAE